MIYSSQRVHVKILACLILFSSLTWSQEFRSTISGRVVDSQGAVIPGVKIIGKQKET